jgi:hypothetical protein
VIFKVIAALIKNKNDKRLFGDAIMGCQMVFIHTKNTNFGAFLKALDWKMLVLFNAIWYYVLSPIGAFYGNVAYLMVIW